MNGSAFFLGLQAALDDHPPLVKKVLVISGPAGVGKTSVMNLVLRDYNSKVAHVAAVTTRPMHKGDKDGSPFHFMTPEAFQQAVDAGQLLAVSEHDGQQYALRAQDLQDAWDGCKVPVVEAPLPLAAALRQAGTPQVLSVYLTADLATLDVRMRKAGTLEEEMLQHELRVAEASMDAAVEYAAMNEQVRAAAAKAAAARAAAPVPSTPATGAKGAPAAPTSASTRVSATGDSQAPAPVPDYAFSSMGTILETYHLAKGIVGDMWHKPKLPVACQAILETFDWKSHTPGTTKMRLRTIMHNSAMLDLPRGKHLLRVSANMEHLHAISFFANPPCDQFSCVAGEYTKVGVMRCQAGFWLPNQGW